MIVTRNQPQGQAALNRASSLSNGLVALVNGAAVWDAVRNAPVASINNPSRVVDQFGIAQLFANPLGQYLDLGQSPSLALTGAAGITLLSWFRINTLSSSSQPQLIARDSNIGGRAYTFDIDSSVNGSPLRFYINGGGGGTGVDIILGSANLSTGIDYLCIAVYDAVAHTAALYVNGVSVIVGTMAAAIPSATTSTRIGARAYSGYEGYFDGRIRLSAIWNRALSRSDIADASANPWQLFAPPRRVRFASVASTTSLSARTSYTRQQAVNRASSY